MADTPRVWCNYTVKSKDGDLKLRIQDAPKDRIEDVLDLYVKYFVPEEAFHRCSGIYKNIDAVEEYKAFTAEVLKQSKIAICCLDNDPNEVGQIIAAGYMLVTKKDDPARHFEFQTEEMKTMAQFSAAGSEKYDVMKELNLDIFYEDKGLVVHKDYRCLGIAQKIFHVRREICTADGIPITGAWVSMIGSQKAAERDGWDVIFEIPYEEISKEYGVVFENVPPTCKYMVAKAI